MLPSALLLPVASLLGIDFSGLLASNNRPVEGPTIIAQLTAPIIRLDEPISLAAGPSHRELFCAITLAWLSGFVFLLALWLRRRRRFHLAMRVRLVLDDTRERQVLKRVRSWLGIKREVRLSMLPGTVEPGVWGVLSPIVLLPKSMAEELSDAELEAVMMHEMIHVARWDNLIANLHRLLCCVFWFHPLIWLLDRLLLAEREHACDEEVIRLGGSADVYASSLLKVLRFCLGWSVAGASNATGSNLGRRVERIMSRSVQVKLSVWHRAAIGSIVALVVILSMVAGFLTRDGVVAQSKKPREGVVGGVPGGVIGGTTGFVMLNGQEKLIERLYQAPETAVEFKNSVKAPLLITDAKVRAVPREKDGPGDEFAVLPVVTLANNTDRQVSGFSLEFRNGPERRAYFERVPSVIEPHTAYTSGGQRRFIILVGEPDGWSVRVGGVAFADGEVWGVVPPPPPPPPPPAALRKLEWAPDAPARFNNLEGAPLSITSATVKAARTERILRNGSDQDSEERYLIKLFVTLVSNTSRRITGLAIEYTNPESKDGLQTYASVKIEPFGTYNLEWPPPEAPGYGALLVPGDPDRRQARVIGAKFEDGEIWGSFPPPPPPPPPPPVLTSGPGDPKVIRKSGGVMMSSAIHRVEPESPPLARAARISGSVVVEVTVDEAGAVISARAISGHPLLKDAAVSAARQWQFNPTHLSGVPVKVIGTLTFNFEP